MSEARKQSRPDDPAAAHWGGDDLTRAIMTSDDPLARARDIFTRHLGMSIGASMVVIGVHASYTWGNDWAWWTLSLIWAAVLVHGLVYLVKRRRPASPAESWDAQQYDDEPGPPPEPADGQGSAAQHKITVVEPRDH